MNASGSERRSVLLAVETDAAARRHLMTSLVFMVVAGALFAGAALKLAFPTFLPGIPGWAYARLRPMALNAAVFGWLTLAHMGTIYFLVPRLSGSPLRFEWLANLNLLASTVLYTAGLVAIGLGFTDGRELLEFPVWLDIPIFLTMLVPTFVVMETVRHRTEPGMYPALWYALAGTVWLPALYLVGNVPGFGGVTSALQTSFFVGGLVTMWLVGIGVGAVYYLLPKITGNPLYSRPLASVGFWSLAFAGPWVGLVRLTYSPAPDWLETVATVLAVGLIAPTVAIAVNFVATLQGRWSSIRTSVPIQFAVAGTVLFVLLAVLIALPGFRSIAAIVGLTSFIDTTIVASIFGLAALWSAAFIYHALPRLLGRRLFSDAAGRWHLWLTVGGLGAWTVLGWMSGTVSGYTWAAGIFSGGFENVGEGFLTTVSAVRPFVVLSTLAAAVAMAGQLVFAYNVYRTYTSGVAIPQEVLAVVGADEDDEGAAP